MYKRITSYIYSYSNGERLNNCGYFRFDVREQQCKLSISVKVPDKYTMGVAEIYILKKSERGLTGILLGKTGGLNGTICYKHMCTVDDIAGDVGINNMAGIVIYNGSDIKKAFAGSMRDEIIDISSFSKEYTEENTVYEIDQECQEEWCAQMTEEEGNIEDLSEPEEDGSIASMEVRDAAESWQEILFSKFPKVRISFDGENSEAIKMRPHDLVWFPRKYWRFSNNQCLLKGYYNYRYIMLVRGKGSREGNYYLAVPGLDCPGEAAAARKQGFDEFVVNNAEVGYWCCKVGQ